jgi:dDENN domain
MEIRQSFLRFFVSIFQNYRDYVDKDKFQSTEFLANGIHGISQNALKFVESTIQTQMFQAFLDERCCCPNDAEVRFFDECITAKQNRSTKKAIHNISLGRTVKKETTFLDDTTYTVRGTWMDK